MGGGYQATEETPSDFRCVYELVSGTHLRERTRSCEPHAIATRVGWVLALVLALLLTGCGGAHRRAAHGRLPKAFTAPSAPPRPRFFAPSSFWNTPLSMGARSDPRSRELSASLRAMVESEVAEKRGPWIAVKGYSTPIYTVSRSQPRVRVILDNLSPALARAFSSVPLKANIRPASGTDAQLTVWQPSTDRLWEFWGMHHEADGWHARWGGAMQHVSRNLGYFHAGAWPGASYHWGATATGLPLVGGLITLEDLRLGHIDHALAIGVPRVAAGIVTWPAQRTDGTSETQGGIPAGTRFRLDPRIDLARLGLPPLTRMISEAAQRYGMVVRDTSGVVDFYAEDPTSTSIDPWPPLLGGGYLWQLLSLFPWDHLEVVRPSAR